VRREPRWCWRSSRSGQSLAILGSPPTLDRAGHRTYLNSPSRHE
jgi:hypothetical protein